MKIYVATSWRNDLQPEVVRGLRHAGHDVYDFRNPREGDRGFWWSDIDPNWESWDAATFRERLSHTIAIKGFESDMAAMPEADAFVLVMPCGRSAHLELGWAVGQGKHTCIILADGEPELMYRMVDKLALNTGEVVDWLSWIKEGRRRKTRPSRNPEG